MISIKRIIQAFMIILLLLPSYRIAHAGVDDPNTKVNSMIDTYDQRLKDIQQLESQQTELYGQLSTINQQIFEYDRLVKELQPKIDEVTKKIQSYQTEIDNAQKRMEDRNSLLKTRLRNIYIDGRVSYLDVLFSSTNFSDFIDRMTYLTMIVMKDQSLIQTINDEKANLDGIQEELQQQKSLLVEQQNTFTTAKADQQKKSDERLSILAQLQQKNQEEKGAAAKEAEELSGIDAQLAPAVEARLKETLVQKIDGSDAWGWPVPSSHEITSDFGSRADGFHAGIDIGAPLGTSIVAVDNGIVLFAGQANGFGHWVVIKHANGLMSVYGHMYGDGIYVTAGQEVKRGQVIAVVGSDGESTGPHLHFGVATGITGTHMDYIDPRTYLGLVTH
ncbi:murein hydrolase activator EnvC family protein [Paenibacillus cremeus]|uniref:Peptidoglycan DD-metalloendopeptidase family protein n=1 Tax=Paenibacillus cremeus TaxID=2163881 RepID=A0A559KGY5_9BACL|nr:M23 family metallopeptidase [Paenibacillus cremeus]TVY11395.1 peptidoglycan DD-metalloendopeptidase family protein [Paenibacillus cremeus]